MTAAAVPLASGSPPPPHYRPDLDGLRAVAIAVVVLYHAEVPGFSGGFVGVDVFFVVSDYLITSLLLPAVEADAPGLGEFYARRIHRLLPAYLVMLVGTTLVGLAGFLPIELAEYGEVVATALGFSSNLHFWQHSGYFDAPAQSSPLLHTWSLAVEAQFYLLYPLGLVLGRRLLGRHLQLLLLTGTVASFVLCVLLATRSPVANFYLLPTRAWELLLGSITFLAVRRGGASAGREALAVTGLGSIIASALLLDGRVPFPGPAALPATLGTALVIASGAGTSGLVHRMLALRPCVALGLMSYSLYLWHWPLLVFVRRFLRPDPGALTTALTLVAAIGLAVLSWRLVERPFRRRQEGRDGMLFASTLGAIGACMAFALLLRTDGVPERFAIDARSAELHRLITAIPAFARAPCAEAWRPDDELFGSCTLDRLQPPGADEREPGHPSTGPTSSPLILLGDSHTKFLLPGVTAVAHRLDRDVHAFTHSGCPVLPGLVVGSPAASARCREFTAAAWRFVEALPPGATVTLHSRWGVYARGTPYSGEGGPDLVVEAERDPAATNAEALGMALRHAVARLSERGQRTLIVGPIPEIGVSVPRRLLLQHRFGTWSDMRPTIVDFEARQAPVLDLLDELALLPGVSVLRPHELFCRDDYCAISREERVLYADDDHLSGFGAEIVADALVTTLSARQ